MGSSCAVTGPRHAVARKGVTVHFEKEQMTFKPDEEADPYTEAMFNMLGTFAQFERRIIRQRQLEGIALAKAAGKYKGQKPKLTAAQLVELREKDALGVPKAEIARQMGVSRKTVYRALDSDYMSIEQWQTATGKTPKQIFERLEALEPEEAADA